MENTRKFTRNLMTKFPSWMKMSKDPASVGAQFLDVFGITFEEFEEELNYISQNIYIGTADTDLIDILYRAPLTEDVVSDFETQFIDIVIKHHDGGIEKVNIVDRVRHLYSRKAKLPTGLINREDGYFYLRINREKILDPLDPIHYIQVNQARHYTVEHHHVWNAFDEFGFLLGLKRLPLESNELFKKRILDVFKNPGGSTQKGILNGLSRELGISKEELKVFSLNDTVHNKKLIRPDGSPTKKMQEYAKNINEKLKFTVDTLNLGEAYWESLEEENLGIYFLPHIWDIDSTIFKTEEFQSGIGFGDDLKVTKPILAESTYRDFQLNVSLVGYFEDYEEFFPEISFEYKIYAQGKILEHSYEEEEFKYTTVASEVFEQDYTVIASQEFGYLHEFLFDDPNNFKKTEDMQFINFGKSNEFLNNQTDNLQRLSLYLSTENDRQSNKIKNLKIDWLDTEGNEHSYIFDNRDKWLNPQVNAAGQPTSTPVTSGTYYNLDEEGLELGRGDFQEEMKTTSDFMRGNYQTNFTLIQDGKIKLNFENINQLIN